ncbi:MAG: tRNA (cytidine(34)-2'-O)-methyltransferase [Pseudomonadota bacterium]
MPELTTRVKAGLRLALFQPDIAPNVGAIIRTCACLGVPLDVIEPCGFPFSLHIVRRQTMDYGDKADITRHDSWDRFQTGRSGRLIAMTTMGSVPLWSFDFRSGDTLLMGQESAGLPDYVHRIADARVCIPMAEGTRSLNIAMAAGIAVAEALRQQRVTAL